MNRRRFLRTAAYASASAAALAALPASLFSQSSPSTATLSLHPDKALATMPADFTGFSYESAQLADPDFFSPHNTRLVALFRRLSPSGVLRIGGNTSEFTYWKAHFYDRPQTVKAAGSAAGNWRPHTVTPITPKAIDNLAAFLDATGWHLIYGLNLGTGTPERAAIEAEYVFHKIGPRLEYFQIGNEPDLYASEGSGLRSPKYAFPDYFAEWLRFAKAVQSKLPGAKFGGPDAAFNPDWIVSFAQQDLQQFKASTVALTGHYYALGPPDSPKTTIENLLRPDPRLTADLVRTFEASHQSGLPYRMAEGNSCYRGGKPGFSDTFASTLWAADYMLSLARAGCTGVNFHGGGSAQIKAGLGGHLPGEGLAPHSPNYVADTTHSGSYYTPIAGSIPEGFHPRAVFTGMFLAAQFTSATFISTEFQPLSASGPVNATAYAAKLTATGQKPGLRVAILNKDAANDLDLHIDAGFSPSEAHAWRLTAPSLDATQSITLAGSTIADDGSWTPTTQEPLTITRGQVAIKVPRASAALIFLG